jgi:putative spermidine/putrescine transport system substrate-binding protein
MRSKKIGVLFLAVLLGVLGGVTQIGAAANEKATINLYTGGSDNVRIAWEAVLQAFQKKNPGINVQLQFLASGTGGQTGVDKLIAAVKAGQREIDIDLLETADNDLVRIFGEAGKNSLSPLPAKEIPNLKYVKSRSAAGGDAALVFRGTTVLLAYNAAAVKKPPKTATELYQWIRKHPGRFAYNDPTTGGAGSSFVITALYNKMPAEALSSSDPKWKEQWKAGFDLLKELHPYFYKASGKVQYPAKNQGTIDLLANGEVDMIPAWADMILDQKSRGLLPETVKLTQIEPAFTGGVQTLVVPALSKNKPAAYKLLNFVISPEGQRIFVEKQKAIPVITPSKLPKETVAQLAGLKVKGFRVYTIGKLSDEIMKLWQSDIATLK